MRFTGDPIEEAHVADLRLDGDSVELVEQHVVEFEGREPGEVMAAEARAFGAEAVVSNSEIVNRAAASTGLGIPVWCDFFGDPMAERQMLAYRAKSDAMLADQWATYSRTLRAGDHFSGCSTYQVGSILGELAVLGRLNHHTAVSPLVSLIPPWVEPLGSINEGDGNAGALRAHGIPEGAFVVIQTGGFNTWVDHETLFEALELAMDRHADLHYATTGGALAGHDESSFGEFRRRVEASPNRARYHFLGWLALDEVGPAIAAADLGLNVDRPGAEGWLGTRNRVMDWLLAGKPVISTLGCELVAELADKEFLSAVDQGDARAIADAIDAVRADTDAHRARAGEGRRYLLDVHSPNRCLAPLLEWARDPKPAPDLHAWSEEAALAPALWRSGEADFVLQAEADRSEAADLRGRLARLEGSRLVRFAIRLRDLIRGR